MVILLRLFVAGRIQFLSHLRGFRVSRNDNPVCLCGDVLHYVHRSGACYNKKEFAYVICDICNEKLSAGQGVYHCRKRKTKKHPIGFDICASCVTKHNYRLKRYHALIIAPPITKGKHNNQDGQTLFDLFSKLHYHSVTILSDKHANRDNILKMLDILNEAHYNDTIVVCYSGHGDVNRQTGGFRFYLDNSKYIDDVEFVTHLSSDEYKCATNYKYRDILLILHACHSGAFKGIKAVNSLPKPAKDKFDNDIGIDEEKKADDLQKDAVDFLNSNDIKEYEMDGMKVEEYVEKFFKNDWMSKKGRIEELHVLMRSIVVLASCRKQEETMCVGGVSPFVKYVIDAFLEFTEVDTEYDYDVTPKSLVDYIKNQSKLSMLDQGYGFDCILYGFQHTNIAQAQGLCAYDFSLKPILKPYR